MLRSSLWCWIGGFKSLISAGLIGLGLMGIGLLGIGLLGLGAFISYPVKAASGAACQVSLDKEVRPQDAEHGEAKSQDPVDAPAEDPEKKELIEKFEKYLSGAKLKGRFTISGRDVPPEDEEYTIISAKKLPERDLWLLEARIKYGKWDETVPLTLPIKWADKTPVITIEKLFIPGMGTFSARVLFNNGMYSGTWAHDDVKGHLFGQVIPGAGLPDSEEPGGSPSDSAPIK